MTERSTKTFIGAFVLGGLALVIAFILLLGSGTLGVKNPTFALLFNSSLKGLNVGSPVYFKGIRIGKVNSIQILPELDGEKFFTPVVIEIEKNTAMMLMHGGKEEELFQHPEALERLIRLGLRAKLGMTSILTGQLCVELDILRNASPVKAEQLMPYKGSPQIPTQLSSLDAALATLDDIPVQEILLDVVASMKRMNEQFQKLDISGLVASLKLTSDAIRTQVEMLGTAAGKTVGAYSDLALSAQKDLDVALKHIHETLDSVESMAGRTSAAMNEAREAMASVQETSKSAGALFAEDSVPVLEFSQTMLALGKAAQALSDLATLLEIKPNSLIFGRNR